MRILHIDGGRELRGGQRQVILLMTALRASGHAGTLMTAPAGPLWSLAAQLDIPLVPWSIANLLRRSPDFELVHVHDARSHTLAAAASQRPFVVSRRVAFPVQRSLASRWKYARARRFLAVSDYVAAELMRAGVPREKIEVVFDAVEVGPPEEVPDSAERPFRAVALATGDPRKGRDLVERASALANLPVHFSEHLSQDLPGASVFLYITRSEGLGSAALLAMRYGVPVIASRVGGLPEAVRDREEGLLVENDPAAIARSLTCLERNRALGQRLGRNGRLRVEQTFTVPQLAVRTVTAYQHALLQT